MSDQPQQIDFLRELKKEQSGFRVYGILFGLLFVVIAVFLGISTFLTVQRLDDVSDTLTETRIANAQVSIDLGFIKRDQETRNESLVIQEQETNATRRFLSIFDPNEAMPDSPEQQARRDREIAQAAVVYAKAHINGTPLPYDLRLMGNAAPSEMYNGLLNWVTSSILSQALESGSLNSDDRLIVTAARADWTGDIETAERTYELLTEVRSNESKAVGYVGLANLKYQQATNDPISPLAWNAGCREAVDFARRAIDDFNSDAASVLIAAGACLRKDGRTAEAYQEFRKALNLAAPDGRPAYPSSSKQLFEAFHGVGTTLIALANAPELAQSAGIELPDNPSNRARELLNEASRFRAEWGMTRVGQVYSEENLGFVFLQEKDYEGALRHTAEMDNVLALAWNLSVRLAAANELAKELGSDEEAATRRGELERVAEEAILKLSLFPYGFFDEPELRRLMPSEYASYVDAGLEAARLSREESIDAGIKAARDGSLGIAILEGSA